MSEAAQSEIFGAANDVRGFLTKYHGVLGDKGRADLLSVIESISQRAHKLKDPAPLVAKQASAVVEDPEVRLRHSTIIRALRFILSPTCDSTPVKQELLAALGIEIDPLATEPFRTALVASVEHYLEPEGVRLRPISKPLPIIQFIRTHLADIVKAEGIYNEIREGDSNASPAQ